MNTVEHHYGKAVRRCTYQILDMFNQLTIKRYDPSGNELNTIEVPIKFGPNEKMYEDLNMMANTTINEDNPLHPILTLPRMGLEFAGLTFRSEAARLIHKEYPVYFYASAISGQAAYSRTHIPIPTDFHYNLIMAGKYMDDILQIYEQVYSMFFPIFAIEMPPDELALGKMEYWQVVPTNFTGPNMKDLTSENNRFFTSEITFKVHGWVYKYQPNDRYWKQIHKVSATVHPSGADTWTSGTISGSEGELLSAVPSAISAYAVSGKEGGVSAMDDADYYLRLQKYY